MPLHSWKLQTLWYDKACKPCIESQNEAFLDFFKTFRIDPNNSGSFSWPKVFLDPNVHPHPYECSRYCRPGIRLMNPCIFETRRSLSLFASNSIYSLLNSDFFWSHRSTFEDSHLSAICSLFCHSGERNMLHLWSFHSTRFVSVWRVDRAR